MKMKKCFTMTLAALLAVLGLAGCGASNETPESEMSAEDEASLSIVTTIFPEYDWVNQVLAGSSVDAEVTMLLDNGVDLHSFQPTAADILRIAGCDLFIYVGGESDEWASGALAEAVNPDMVVLDLMELLGDTVREEETVEGMEEDEEEDDEVEYDEHVWLSLRNASVCVGAIAEAIEGLDPANAEVYQRNASEYQEKLAALDEVYQVTVDAAPIHTVLFGDRFPFRYLTDDYDLTYYAAFSGCSAETEASFETITFLAKKVDEVALPAVLTIEGTDHRVAETIVENTAEKNQKVLTLDSMQSTNAKDVKDGANYLSIMEENLTVLAEALGAEHE